VGGSDTPFCASERFLPPPQTLSSLILLALRYSRRSWVTPGGFQEALIIAHHHCHACPRSITIGTWVTNPTGAEERRAVSMVTAAAKTTRALENQRNESFKYYLRTEKD